MAGLSHEELEKIEAWRRDAGSLSALYSGQLLYHLGVQDLLLRQAEAALTLAKGQLALHAEYGCSGNPGYQGAEHPTNIALDIALQAIREHLGEEH